MSNRLSRAIHTLKKKARLPYLVTDICNIRYLTGFSGSYAWLLLNEGRSFFISDSRYEEYARSILPKSVAFTLQKGDIFSLLKGMIKDNGFQQVYLEEQALTLSTYLQMRKELRGTKIIPGENEINILRMEKDATELPILRKAAEITDRCFNHLLKFIKPGIYEWDIAVEIEHFYRQNGCRKTSFDSIVASGHGSSMPHYETSMKKKVRAGDVILIDMGCTYEGYNSDLTRTIFLNSIDAEIEKIYHIVREAQEQAIAAVRAGITTGKLDSAARDYIASRGYGENFGHSLGHGLGMEVHELPAIKKNGSLRLKKNMAITIEPGIYLPGLGGVRIEDMVLVTSRGHEVLTGSNKDIIVI
ncbi:MAG: hypothetical protein CVV44_03460 [Spirochaetae bacterium HGW-Spirochaetae-1]|jgi:Xaa-Pro aminopeptidase|nr:MAG: hypothetical protein CVV44_03460 [Spirochaetae bacterium HGW-Spirochaetae-1]